MEKLYNGRGEMGNGEIYDNTYKNVFYKNVYRYFNFKSFKQ